MDELRQVRGLAEEVPRPDPDRKARARDELLQLADEEQTAATAPSATPEPRAGWLDRVAAAARWWLRPAPAAGLAAAAVGLVGAGVLLSGPTVDRPPELADPDTPAPEATDPEADDPTADDPDRGTDEPGTDEPGTDGSAPDEDTVELAASCEGPDGRVTVDYPEGWYTPQDDEPGACRFFGEDGFDVDAAIGGAPLATLEIAIEPAQLDGFLGDELGLVEQEREELEGTDRRTVRQRLESTGEAMLPDGAVMERYLVDLDGDTLIASSQADDAQTLDDRREVLESMVRSLEVEPD